MTSAQDRSTLAWIRGALGEVIAEARNFLEEYVEGDRDASSMEGFADRLHKVYGTLQLLELYGPAMLAEEMELTARSLACGQVARAQEAAETLMLGLVRPPDYLAKLQTGGADVPLVLLPLLNDLRTARDATLLSEVALFHPEFDRQTLPPHVVGVPNDKLQRSARALRPKYHRGLLALYRGLEPKQGLRLLRKVVAVLEGATATAQSYQLFRALHGLVQGLLKGDVDSSATVKQLFARVDREIKRVIDRGEDALVDDPPEDLLKNLLYYVARASSKDALVQSVRREFRLDQAFPSEQQLAVARESLAAPSLDIFNTVRDEIKAELIHVKDALDLFLRGGGGRPEELASLEPRLSKIADTLGMMGHGALRTRLNQQTARLAKIAQGEQGASESDLMEIAGEILTVEASLGEEPEAGPGGEGPAEKAASPGEGLELRPTAALAGWSRSPCARPRSRWRGPRRSSRHSPKTTSSSTGSVRSQGVSAPSPGFSACSSWTSPQRS